MFDSKLTRERKEIEEQAEENKINELIEDMFVLKQSIKITEEQFNELKQQLENPKNNKYVTIIEADSNELERLRKENEELKYKNKSIVELNQCLMESINRVTIFDKDRYK